MLETCRELKIKINTWKGICASRWSFTKDSASSWFYYKEICYDARSHERKIQRHIFVNVYVSSREVHVILARF